MLPTEKKRHFHLLTILEDKKPHTLDEYRASLVEKFDLTESDLIPKTIDSKGNSRLKFNIRTADDISILKSKTHLEHTEKAVFHITPLGLRHLYNLKSAGEK